VTGAAGFVGSHVVTALREDDVPVVAMMRRGVADPGQEGLRVIMADLRDTAAIDAAIADVRPDVIYHCAGAAHVQRAWHTSAEALETNVIGTHRLLDAVRRARLAPRVLIPGSAMIYRPTTEIIGEGHPIGPTNPYGLSKVAVELLAQRAVGEDGIPALIARPFNHVGPRQDPSFFSAAFARQIARIEAGALEPVIAVGNLDAERDLTDVRDTVRAYRMLVERGEPGRPYNVCSGRAYRVGDILERLLALAHVRIEVRSDPALFRPNDIPRLCGSAQRIESEIGWRPEIPIGDTLQNLLAYWRVVVNPAPGGRLDIPLPIR
jgi:GDP-4-dehydro-6-deoxy-D-mannose reductase